MKDSGVSWEITRYGCLFGSPKYNDGVHKFSENYWLRGVKLWEKKSKMEKLMIEVILKHENAFQAVYYTNSS